MAEVTDQIQPNQLHTSTDLQKPNLQPRDQTKHVL